MHYLSFMLAVLMVCMVVVIVGLMAFRDPWQSIQNALHESLAWGVAFFLSFGAEIFIIELAIN